MAHSSTAFSPPSSSSSSPSGSSAPARAPAPAAPADARLLAALALIHDALKEVDCVRQLAERLAAEPATASPRAARDAAAVRELARGVAARLRGFLDGETASGRPVLHPLGELVERAVARTALVHPAALVRLELSDEAAAVPLPEAVTELLVPLLDNAATHGASRQPARVRAVRAGERVEIAVVDAGPGMPEHALRACQRLGYTTARANGHRGIGLAAAAALARALGGALRVESRRDAGTTVTLELPLAGG